MTSITHAPAASPSVAVMTAEELAAFAKRLTTLPIAPGERRIVLGHLQEAMQHLFDAALAVSIGLAEDGPDAEEARDAAHEAALAASVTRDRFSEAVASIEDMEQDALVSAGAQDGGQA
ncbi:MULTISPECIES: hypothetical protein [Streptosporangiaceae]|uniref:hypothetical protein n=1 Tax=Streptosporangiaceae TaxID=2004 RepID=UPI0033DE0C35